MKERNWKELLKLLLIPGLLIFLGVILIVNPDSGAVLAAKILAWVLLLIGIGCVLGAFRGEPRYQAGRIIAAAVCLGLGAWLLNNPLMLAKSIGRILGLLLLVNGVRDLRSDHSRGAASIGLTVLGAILILLPMITSRVFFTILGIVILGAGITELVNRLHRDDGNSDTDIVDV